MALMATTSQNHMAPCVSSSKGVPGGGRLMHHNAWRSSAWDVVTHGCFITYPHHDAGGQLTYSYVRTGATIWGFLDLANVDNNDQKVVAKGWSDYYSSAIATETYDKGVSLGTILLERGAVL